MVRKIFTFFLFLALAAFPSAFSQQKKGESPVALVGATLLDGTGAQPIANAVVLIMGEKIQAAGPASTITIPKDARRIDVSGKWILPGFIDCHIHTTYPFTEAQAFTDTDSLSTLRALSVMNKYLRAGVTSVRDAGAPIEPMRALTQAAQLGTIESIRLFSCGYLLTTTGGHGDGSRLAKAVDGPWEFRKAVREMYKAGFRHIKISPTFTLEEVKAAVEEAKTLGLRITGHGGGFSDTIPTTMTRIAVEGGVQCIEHLNEMDDDVLDLMAAKGVYNVPTLAIMRELYKANAVPKFLVEKRGWVSSLHEGLFKKARARKIVMGIGTDAVGPWMNSYPQVYFTEMKYYLELGATPMETIVDATRNGALILGEADKLGTLEKGKLADLQVINGDPLKSFDALGQPEIVIVGGKVHEFK